LLFFSFFIIQRILLFLIKRVEPRFLLRETIEFLQLNDLNTPGEHQSLSSKRKQNQTYNCQQALISKPHVKTRVTKKQLKEKTT
jgi:hypothetical protein